MKQIAIIAIIAAVVIIGLAKAADAPKNRRLFSYDDINGEPHESVHGALTPYLFVYDADPGVHDAIQTMVARSRFDLVLARLTCYPLPTISGPATPV